ncbi:MAG: DUF4837 family protein [Mucinivorans sp.]
MKKLILALVALVSFSCGTKVGQTVVTGKPYELFVITEKSTFDGVVGDTLRSIFNQEVEWINQPEPIFDVYNINPAAFNDLTRRHRNLIFINLDPKYGVSEMSARYDAYAKGQICVDINSPSADSASLYLWQNRALLEQILSKTERDRFVERVNKYAQSDIEELITKQFGFHLGIPRGYRLRVDTADYMWISNEMPLASQGLILYTFKSTGTESPSSLIAQRNLTVRNIPGPSKGSYMTTDTTFTPEARLFDINGYKWTEIRGFWKVQNDFMGGPFINYTIYDSTNNRFIGIDMYVSSPSPKYGKRNYIRQLEALPLTFKMVADGSTVNKK